MKRYIIRFSKEANDDLDDIVRYISENLNEPNIANNIMNALNCGILKLEYMAESFKKLEIKTVNNCEYRKIIIKKYLVIYSIDKDKKIVDIKRIIYGRSNWINRL